MRHRWYSCEWCNCLLLLCLTNIFVSGSHSDGDRAMYVASLGSQASQLGFGAPMARSRRGTFQSSYDPSIRLKAGPNFKGTVCPKGHMCLFRSYGKSIRYCDECDLEIADGSVGERCSVCDFDLCPECSSDAPGRTTDAFVQGGLSSPSNVRVSSSTDASAQDGLASPSPTVHIAAAPPDPCNATKIHPFFLPRPKFNHPETTTGNASAADEMPSCNILTQTAIAATEMDDCDGLPPPPHKLPGNTPVPRTYRLGAHRMKLKIVLKAKTASSSEAAKTTSLFATMEPQTPSGTPNQQHNMVQT